MSSEAELRQILAQVMQRLEAVTARLEKIEGGAAPAAAAEPACACEEEMPKAQKAFLDLVEEHLKPQVERAKAFDEVLSQCMNDLYELVMKEADLIGLAAKSQKPTQENLMKLVGPISQLMMKVGEYKDKNFRSPYINYFTALAEACPVFGWVVVEKTPGPYVNDLIPGSEFYTNKILVQTKGKEQEKYDWALGFIKFLKEIVVYIKQYHTTGLTWNPKGGDAMNCQVEKKEEKKVEEVKKEEPKVEEKKEEKKPVNPAGLFAELNKGTAISGGLKHVTADMKTKNMKPEDKKPLEPKAKAPVQPKTTQQKPAVQKPPKMEKLGTKWDISYQNGNRTMEVDGDFRDSIYCFKCENSALRVKGKINCISIDSCKKLTLICDTVVSYIELVNCNSVDVRIIELTPTVNIDKSQSVVVHLSDKCLDGNTTVNTSKCDAINMAFPNPEDPDDEVEYAVPEQFYTIVKENKLYPQIYFHDKSSYWFPK